MALKILVGPETPLAGSHGAVTSAAAFVPFKFDLAGAVAAHKPDVVLLRAAGHNGIGPDEIHACPVPVVGAYHDWTAWSSERLEALARTYDLLITEKTAVEYLRGAGHDNAVPYLMMSYYGLERVRNLGVTRRDETLYHGAFLGSFTVDSHRNPYRLREFDDPFSRIDNLYLSRLGFRRRSPYLADMADLDGPVFIGARIDSSRLPFAGAVSQTASFEILGRSTCAVHVDAGRRYAANRCFEVLGIGTLLLVEEGCELLDFMPPGCLATFAPGGLRHALAHWADHPREAAEVAAAGRAYAVENFQTQQLARGVARIIEDNIDRLRRRAADRVSRPQDYRAQVHWEGGNLLHYRQNTAFLRRAPSHPTVSNEAGFYWYDVYRKSLDPVMLERARAALADACDGAPDNMVFAWNRAVVELEAGDPRLGRECLDHAGRLAGRGGAAWTGSRIEICRDWWLSGHVEYDLALAKIDGDHAEAEHRAMRWRVGMLRGDGDIHWPEMPDEHRRNGDMETVGRIDPLDHPSDKLRKRIHDLDG